MRDFARATLDQGGKIKGPFEKVLRLVDLEKHLGDEEKELFESFVVTIENHLGYKSEPIRLSELWTSDPPSEANGQEMDEFLGEVRPEAINLLVTSLT